jgi:NAD(P)-dependent dehydrogenase (short-subunit alcohol dehydrogenase family)
MSFVIPAFDEDYGVVVIGGGSGIGEEAARVFAARGARVVVMDREEASAEATAAGIRAAGGEARSCHADVTDLESLRSAFATAVEWTGQVHAVVNTAGIQGQQGLPSHEVSVETFEQVLSVNLTAALRIAQVVIPHMLEHGYGRIAHLASIAGKEGNPYMAGYSASKAGLIGLVKAQGKEYAETGITVNALAPAVIHTPFLDSQPQASVDYMTAKIPMGRLGTVAEVAEILAFMISPACSFTTGFVFDLSGGRATY